MNIVSPSPRIESVAWGRMDIDGIGTGKDFKLYPGGGRQWDWRETGTRHVPGIQPTDVEELLDHGSRVVVLSKGMLRALHTDPRTVELLTKAGVSVYVEETRKAVERYNRLAATDAVGGLFHSTC